MQIRPTTKGLGPFRPMIVVDGEEFILNEEYKHEAGADNKSETSIIHLRQALMARLTELGFKKEG